MRFWDSSALVPLLVEEQSTAEMRAQYAKDDELVVWWGTEVECTSAITRRLHTGALASGLADDAALRLIHLATSWTEIGPSQVLRERALSLLRTHDLRAADALQLAAAVAAAEGRPPTLTFLSLDGRLNRAARVEGFRVPDPSV